MQVTSTTFLPLLLSAHDRRYREECVLDQYIEGLLVGYSYGPPYGERLVSWPDLDRMGLSRRALRHRAAGNLDDMLDLAKVHGQPPALMLSFDGIESSLLLADEFWDGLEAAVPGELVVGVPARDVVIVTGSHSRPGLDRARRAVDRIFFAGDEHLLLRHLLVRRSRQWEAL